jgi:hypothetical protein
MFRYGGPIKEGVMSGIREPHANGGRTIAGGNQMGIPMGNRTGFQNPLKIKDKIISSGVKTGIRKYLPQLEGIGGRTVNRIKNWWSGDPSRYGVPAASGVKQKIAGHFSGSGTAPLLTNRYYWEKGIKPAGQLAMWAGKKALPYATTGGLIFSGGMWLWPDGTPANNDEIKKNVKTSGPGKVPGANSDLYWQDPEKAKLAAAKAQKEKIQKYRDIMDIKGMNKEAAANSLIEASRLISESGDFKGDLKSGKLINQIIQGASKAFDKPKATKDAIDTLILKGEIEKDLNKDKNAIMDAYRMKQIELADKQLNESLTEKAIKFAGTMKKPYVDQETAIMTIRDQFDVTPNIVLSEKDMEEVKKQDDYKNETDVFTKIVDKQALGPGYYVMGSSGFVVDEGGNIKQIL